MNASGELTLSDLMFQLGIRVGSRDWGTGANNTVTIPDDPAQRQLLINAINRGRRELYSRMPEARVFEPTMQMQLDPTGLLPITIDGDSSKYRLPYTVEGFAGGQFEWAVPVDGDSVTGWGGIISQCHQSDLMALHSVTSTQQVNSWPQKIALARQLLSNPSDPARKVVDYLWVWPKPDQTYLIRGQLRVGYGALTELDDLEPMGQQHLESVLAFSERAWHMGQCDQDVWQTLQQRCEEAVQVSLNLDSARGPQALGVGIDPDSEREMRKYKYGNIFPERWSMVDSVSGQSVL